jgi:hypothetical protein
MGQRHVLINRRVELRGAVRLSETQIDATTYRNAEILFHDGDANRILIPGKHGLLVSRFGSNSSGGTPDGPFDLVFGHLNFPTVIDIPKGTIP